MGPNSGLCWDYVGYKTLAKDTSKEAQKILVNYTWPGNVRELENVLQRAIVLSENSVIDHTHIMIDLNDKNSLYQNFEEEQKKAVI